MIDAIVKRVEFTSPLSVADGVARLDSQLGSNWNPFTRKAFVGNATAGRITIRKRIFYNNSFQTVFAGRLESDVRGSRLYGVFRMHLFTLVFMAAWFGMLMMFAITSLAHAATDRLTFFAGCLGMICFGIVLVGFGRWLARNEASVISDFICSTLNATPRFIED